MPIEDTMIEEELVEEELPKEELAEEELSGASALPVYPALKSHTPTSSIPPSSRSRFTRAPRGGLSLEERDEALLCDLFLFRVLSREQIQRLHFGSVPRANSRLRKLFDFGFVHRHYLALAPWGSPALYYPASAAIPAIGRELERRGLEVDPGEIARVCRVKSAPAFLEHTLAIADFYLRLRDETRHEIRSQTLQSLPEHLPYPTVEVKFEIDLWLPETLCRHEYDIRELGATGWRREVFKPDAFVRLRDRPPIPSVGGPSVSESQAEMISAFIEIDLGHVSAALFRAKWESYRRYAQSGLFAQSYSCASSSSSASDEKYETGSSAGTPPGTASGIPSFVVLVVTTGPLRLRHLLSLVEEAMEDVGAASQSGEDAGKEEFEFRFATMRDLQQGGVLGLVWHAPFGTGPMHPFLHSIEVSGEAPGEASGQGETL